MNKPADGEQEGEGDWGNKKHRIESHTMNLKPCE